MVTKEETLEWNNLKIPYVVDFGKRKNIYISIKNNLVTIKVPYKTSSKVIDEVLDRKKDWIIEKYQLQTRRFKKEQEYEGGDIFTILGEDYTLRYQYEESYRIQVAIDISELVIHMPSIYKDSNRKNLVQSEVDRFLLHLITQKIQERLHILSKITLLYPKKVTVKKLTSSWGRCSSSGNISFNKDLVFYKEKVIDYVILHELCHLKHMNHSKDFWALVKQYMPDYKEQEKVLNKKEKN